MCKGWSLWSSTSIYYLRLYYSSLPNVTPPQATARAGAGTRARVRPMAGAWLGWRGRGRPPPWPPSPAPPPWPSSRATRSPPAGWGPSRPLTGRRCPWAAWRWRTPCGSTASPWWSGNPSTSSSCSPSWATASAWRSTHPSPTATATRRTLFWWVLV